MTTQLPNEIWWQIFDQIDNMVDLWNLGNVSQTYIYLNISFRHISKKSFKAKMEDPNTCPKLSINLKEICMEKEILLVSY
jgi:hypothetical protein